MPDTPIADEPIVSLHDPRAKAPPPRGESVARPSFPGPKYHLPMPYPRPALVDLRGFPRPVLAEQMARIIWTDHHDGVGFRSYGTVVSTIETMRRFGDFLTEKDPEGAIRSFWDVTAETVDAFDVWAHETWPKGSTSPFTLLTCLSKLLRAAVENRFADRALTDRLAYVSRLHDPVETTPRDAYSPFVMEQIRQGARTAVRRTLLRMAEARHAHVPRPNPDGSIRADQVIGHLRHVGFIGDHKRFTKQMRRAGGPTLAPLLDAVYPGLPDLVPFAILMACDCGLPPESIQELGKDCLTEDEADFGLGSLAYRKRRRNGTEEEFHEPVKTKARWSTGWLVKAVRMITETTRAQMPDVDRGRLFVGRAGESLKALWLNPAAFEAHLRRHPVEDENGEPLDAILLGRIRKSAKAKLYAEVGGDLARIGKDHTRHVFATRYASIAALADTHEGSIEASLTAGLDAALGTKVVTEDDERRLREDPAKGASELGCTPEQLLAAFDGTSDVWLAGCLDFGNSPYEGRADGDTRHCGAPLWGCLDCRNAVVTASKLPSLLRLLEHLRLQRQKMSLTAFERNYGFVFVRAEQIVAQFPDRVVNDALARSDDRMDRDWSLAQLTYNV